MVEMRANNAWNTCWNCNYLLLINVLKMALWYRNM